MKHTAIISQHRATCSCGQMQGAWRMEAEAVGVFTLRAYAAWQAHKEQAEAPELVLFQFRRESEPDAPAGLFV